MVELTLPKNSRMVEGTVWPKPQGAKRLTEFRIYRYDPDGETNPRIDTYYVDRDDCGHNHRDQHSKCRYADWFRHPDRNDRCGIQSGVWHPAVSARLCLQPYESFSEALIQPWFALPTALNTHALSARYIRCHSTSYRYAPDDNR